ncbi:SIR2 family protein [Pedobacter gandavensis]|uniref:SIR2 family protein n=1 Tax=Pedobacter gandavensis TaxID=2679963 RepID=UPI00292F7100|nr:SIR2 family protein [Pedobacter gandavensis]
MSKTTYTSLKKYYNDQEKYLFLGNGMNQLLNVISWDQLMESVCRRLKVDIKRNDKPYQLFFEQLAFDINSKRLVEENIKELKEIMGAEAMKLMPNSLLQRIIGSGYYRHYMTSNYDYCIERAIDPNFDSQQFKHLKRPKYSLYRYNLVNDTKVWHIHGECDNGYRGKLANFPEASILIGFEHYADYLEKIHHLLKDPLGNGLSVLLDKSQENWVHLFFTRDIDILGFGLDFTETHLWFIINFRARLKRKGAKLLNKIRWVIPEFSAARQKDRIEILTSLGIEVKLIPAPDKDYTRFYVNFINTFC